jgi:hypothetical protein
MLYEWWRCRKLIGWTLRTLVTGSKAAAVTVSRAAAMCGTLQPLVEQLLDSYATLDLTHIF